MVIGKKQKTFYKKLDMIFSIFKADQVDDGREVLFIQDDVIYFATYYIGGSVAIKYVETSERMKDGFYQIRQLPKKDYVLELIDDDKVKDEDIDVKGKIINLLDTKRYVFHLYESYNSISDIINQTHLILRDSDLKIITKLEDYDVCVNTGVLILEKTEEKEKEGLTVCTNMMFMCIMDNQTKDK